MSDADEVEEIRQRKLEQLMTGSSETSVEEQTGGFSTPTEPIHIESQSHLDEVTANYDVVLVDFHADWCGPCQMLEPTVKEIARTTAAAVAKVDVDQHQALAGQLGIQGVPTLFLFVKGEPVERLVGVQDQGTLTNLIEQYT